MVFALKCTVFCKAVQILWSSYVYFQKAVQPLKNCTTKEKSCASLVHCCWLLISLTMVCVPKCTVFLKLYKLCGPHMYILKSCTTIKKLQNQRKKLYIFGTLSLAPDFIHSAVCSKIHIFFQTCTNSVVLICIFLKSCTTIKKLYNHRKKLYIFGTLSLALNFNVNGVCTKMYSFSKAVQILWSSYVYI